MEYYKPVFELQDDHGTNHISVYSQEGGAAVAMTSSNNIGFGAQRVGMRTGVLFNDVMDDFSTPGTVNSYGLPASRSNYIEPGKRPQSSMSPTIVMNRDEEIALVTGAAGGSKILTSLAQVFQLKSLFLG